jgi:2-phospho-L-lactate guanylyltransferase (CobY/MobA/RfbA family)
VHRAALGELLAVEVTEQDQVVVVAAEVEALSRRVLRRLMSASSARTTGAPPDVGAGTRSGSGAGGSGSA